MNRTGINTVAQKHSNQYVIDRFAKKINKKNDSFI